MIPRGATEITIFIELKEISFQSNQAKYHWWVVKPCQTQIYIL